MPRPRMHHGRPGTRVIPKNWAADHAHVAARTLVDGTGTLTRGGSAAPVFNPGIGRSETPDPGPYWTGGARVQVTDSVANQQTTGDDTIVTQTYLVVVPLEVEAAEDDVFVLTAGDDPTLVGLPLLVRAVTRGTHRFERDLTCVQHSAGRAAS